MRRPAVLATAACAALLLVFPAGPATAASSTLRTPESGRVTGPTALEIGIEREHGGEPTGTVLAALRRPDGEDGGADGDDGGDGGDGGGGALGEPVELVCEGACEDTDRRLVYVLPDDGVFDPAAGAPFGAEAPLANGRYLLEVTLDREDNPFFGNETHTHELQLAVPPSAVTDLEAGVEGAGDDATVSLSWTPAPEPDVEHYRVERHDGEQWAEVTTTSSDAAADEPGGGEHRYRVVTVRPDAGEGTLETASEEATVAVDEVGEDGDGDDGDDGGDGGDGEDPDGDGGEDPDGDDGGDDEDPGGDGGSADGGTGDPPAVEDGDRAPAARAPEIRSGGQGSVPDVGERADDDYEEELDYGEMGDDEAADDVTVAAPGGWRGTVDRIFDADRVAVPIAAGLVMTVTGLHLWRWLRLPV